MNKNEALEKRNVLAAEKVIKNLQMRHMEAYYAESSEEALKIALSLIPEGSSVGWGGSFSIEEIGLKDAVKNGPYKYIDRDTAKDQDERNELMRQCLTADTFIMGTNALSETGEMVNIDGVGNRVAALCFGPKSVIVIAGMNKLTKSLDEAMDRARHYASPVNMQRFSTTTACSKTGTCGDCLAELCCGQIVITRNCSPAGRIKVILVNDSLGI